MEALGGKGELINQSVNHKDRARPVFDMANKLPKRRLQICLGMGLLPVPGFKYGCTESPEKKNDDKKPTNKQTCEVKVI